MHMSTTECKHSCIQAIRTNISKSWSGDGGNGNAMNSTEEEVGKIVRFNKTTRLARNQTVTYTLPNMTRYGYVPSLLDFGTMHDIQVQATVGGTVLVNLQEAYFSVQQQVELNDHMKHIASGNPVVVKLTNRYTKAQDSSLVVHYREHPGSVIYQATITESDLPDLMETIADAGIISALVIKTSKRLKSAKLVPTIDDNFGLMAGALLDVSDNDGGEGSTVAICLDESKIREYTRWTQIQLTPIKIRDTSKKTEDEEEDEMVMYVLAYGYNN